MRRRTAAPNASPIPWPQLGTVLLGAFLGPFGGMITGFALPSIARDFSIDLQTVKWVTLIFWLVTTFLVPVTGFLGRRFGEARMFIAGFTLDALGTLLCALTPQADFALLLCFRAIQGIGSATMFALFGALITRIVPPERRGLAFGLAGATVAVSVTLAPVLGGLVLGGTGWRGVFLIQLPIHACGIFFALRLLRREAIGLPEPFPWASAVSWLALTGGLVLTAEHFSSGLFPTRLTLLLALSFAGLLAFLWCELRTRPLFEYGLFRIPAIRMAASGALLTNIALFAMLLLLPFYFEDYLRYSPERMGLLMSLSPLLTLFISPLAGAVSDRIGFRLPVWAGLGCAAGSYACFASGLGPGAEGRLGLLVAGLLLNGASGGLFNSPAMSAMMGSAGALLRSEASAFSSLMRNLGFMGGTALGSLWLGMFIGLHPLGGPAMQAAARHHELALAVPQTVFLASTAGVFWICVGITLLALILCLPFPQRVRAPEPRATAEPVA